MSIVTIMYTIYSGNPVGKRRVFLTPGGLSDIIFVVHFTREHNMWKFERYDQKMLVAVTNCASHGGAFFFRKPREARPIECSLLDLHELAEETGISVDEVICGLEDFDSADVLMGFGVPSAEPLHVRDFLHIDADLTPRISREPLFAEEEIPDLPFGATRIFPEEPQEVFIAPESESPAMEEIIFGAVAEPAPVEPAQEAEPIEMIEAIEEAETIEVVEASEKIEAVEFFETSEEIENVEIVEAVVPTAEEEQPVPAPEKKGAEAPQPVVEESENAEAEAPKAELPAVTPPVPKKAVHIPHLDLDAIRRISTVRVEAAEPEGDEEDEPLMDLTVPEGYAVQTTTENIVWPWEIREDLTLKEALESLDDKLLTSLTEEVVSCTISGEMGEGGIKSLCETYSRAKEQIYSAIQQESRRRITRMNAKPRASVGATSDATLELAMRMAKQFLETEMSKEKATRFQSTIPNDDGNYYIFQKHRIEDEESVEFPNERVYYRETGNGWAISVGY